MTLRRQTPREADAGRIEQRKNPVVPRGPDRFQAVSEKQQDNARQHDRQ